MPPQQQTFTNVTPIPQQQTFSDVTPISADQPPRGFLADLADKLPGSADTGLKGAVTHLGDTYQALKPAVDSSAPGMLYQLYKKATGQPNDVQKLPGEMVQTFALGTDPEAETEAVTPKAAPEAGSQPGMLSRAAEVAKRRISDNFIVKGAKDLDYVVRGNGGPETPSAPQPQVPAHWGTGKFGSPVDQWGQRIQTDPDLEKASSLLYGPQVVQDPAAGLGQIPVRSPGQAGSIADSISQTSAPQRGSLRQMVNDVGDQVGKSLNASPPPNPKEPIYQRGNLSSQMQGGDSDLPQGHTAVQSSALKSYRYIPESNEFHAQYGSGNGTVHVFGDVSPEEAQQFEQAKSKGQAMQQVKNGHPLVAKIINGRRQAVTPTQ